MAKLRKLKKALKNRQLLMYGLLVIILVAFFGIGFWLINRPVQKQYNIIDDCGIIVNQIFHSYETNASCRSMCRAQCMSNDEIFVSSEFIPADQGCHKCDCYCKS